MKTAEPIFVSETGKRVYDNKTVDWVDVWLTKQAITKLKKQGHLVVTDGGIVVRLMTAEDKIVITKPLEEKWKE